MQRRTRTASTVEAPRQRVYAVLADESRYPEWLPGVEGARVLAREGDVAVLELRAPRFRAGKVVLELIHSPPGEIRFREVGGFGKPAVAGRCELRGDGAGGTFVLLDVRIAAPLIAFGSRRRLRSAAAAAVASLVERIADVEAGKAPAPGGKRKVLEILERDGGLEIVLSDERYRLIPAEAGGEAP